MPRNDRKARGGQAEGSGKTFQKRKYKHSAVESGISRLEHHGLNWCLDKGLKAFLRGIVHWELWQRIYTI
ncbi:MAG: hypothetical protein OZ917_05020 [Candidatus Brocadiaceae bacterium]|nr:hypothetical protein [Candidatus Brocadiaceae bacterium]